MSALQTQIGGSHYKSLKIQPIEYIHANNIPFAEGSIIKYVTRWRDKNGIADLEKARHFIDLLIELERKQMRAESVATFTPEQENTNDMIKSLLKRKIEGGLNDAR